MGEAALMLEGDDGSGRDTFWRNLEGQMSGGGSSFASESPGARRANVQGILVEGETVESPQTKAKPS